MKKLKIIFYTSIVYFFVYGFQIVLVHKFVDPVITPLMVLRIVEGGIEGDSIIGIHKKWKDIEEISPTMIEAIVLAEDRIFFEHRGFNWEGIKKAREYNRTHDGKLIGWSTISQQTAKNLFLLPHKLWIRKGVEAYYTFLIETLWSKKRILEVYMNIIETGEYMYGVEVASYRYFNKSTYELTKTEAALIASILPSPTSRSPLKPSKRVTKKATRVRQEFDQFELPESIVKR